MGTLLVRPFGAPRGRARRTAGQQHEVWHAYLPDIRRDRLYATSFYGPYAPEAGHRFTTKQLRLDPLTHWNCAATSTGTNSVFWLSVGHNAPISPSTGALRSIP